MGNDNKDCTNGKCETGKCGKMMIPIMIIVLVLIVAGVFVYSNNNTNENSSEIIKDTTLVDEVTEIATNNQKAGYDTYDISKLSDTKINILQFHADWCPSCVALDGNLKKSNIPENLNILKVNYDTETELKQKYGITMQHASVQVDVNGNMIKKFEGVMNVDDYLNNIQDDSNNNTIDKMEDKTQGSELEKKEMEQNDTTEINKAESIANTISSGYRVYSPELLSANTTNVLFFAASWCPSCQSADKNFSSETIPSNINLLKVDYDTYSDLKEKYSITMQHTYVQVDQNGNQIKKWSGSKNVDDVLKEIK